METEQNYLQQNISRLLKQTSASDRPNPAFADSLINNAMNELKRSDISSTALPGMKMDRIMKAAAIITIACGAIFEVILSVLTWVSTSFVTAAIMAVIVNGFTYLGGLLL